MDDARNCDDDMIARVGRALVMGQSEAIVVADPNGVIRIWNPGAARMFGWRADQALGVSLDLIIPEPLRARHWKAWDRFIETGQSKYSDGELLRVPGLHSDGHRLSLEFTITPVMGDEGSVEMLVAVLRDQTARFNEMKALRQQLADARAGDAAGTSG